MSALRTNHLRRGEGDGVAAATGAMHAPEDASVVAAAGGSDAVKALREKLAGAGVVLLLCSPNGDLVADAALSNIAQTGNESLQSHNLLYALLTKSRLFASLVNQAAQHWSQANAAGHPIQAVEAAPGLWLAPMPLSARRRLAGFALAVLPTFAFLESEQMSAMCQAAQVDVSLHKRLLAQLPPCSEADVPRQAALVRFIHEDQLRLAASGGQLEVTGRQLAESYEEISLLYTIISGMSVQKPPERFVALACRELLKTIPYTWIGAQLADDREKLKSLAGRLVLAGEPGCPAAQVRAAARRLVEELSPQSGLVLEPGSNPRHQQFAALGRTVVVQPVISASRFLGVLIAGEKRGPDTAVSSVDIKLVGAAAAHMAIHLENASLYEDVNAMFMGTLEALTASIDAKDRYTCGHSRRVAHLTRQLATAIELDQHTIERMHIAGLVHDVGKIGVPESVLLKPGKLDAAEFEWIRKHPEIGYRILKDIPHLQDVLPGVLHHHERWDGRGYPHGIAGEAIPLVARVIALADSFDAMSSTRTYRSSMSRFQALEEIRRSAGSQFDPELARVFVKLDFSEFDRLVSDFAESNQLLSNSAAASLSSHLSRGKLELGEAA